MRWSDGVRWIDKLSLRLRTVFLRERVEQELSSEFQFHLDQQIAENIAKGMSREEARYAALRTIGGISQIQEQCRDARGLNLLETTRQDLRYAIRNLRKAPAFTAVAVFSLALGIGANTAIFSLIDSFLLNTLPVRNPQQLFFLRTNRVKVGHFQVSHTLLNRDIDLMQQRATQDQGIASFQEVSRLSVAVSGHAELSPGEFVSGAYFDVLGVPAYLGRAMVPADNLRSANGGRGWPAMISYGYWQRRFGGTANVIGSAVDINTIPFTIVGVMPPAFSGIALDEPADLVMPMITQAQVEAGSASAGFPKPDNSAGMPFLRLKPGASPQSAAAELTVIFHDAEAAAATNNPRKDEIARRFIELDPAHRGTSGLRSRFSEPLQALMAVVAVVMLIACANIASLLLARSNARRREFAIRLSLGCSRGRIIRQMLTESLMLSVIGSAAGVIFAFWARTLIVRIATSGQPYSPAFLMHWDLRLLAFLSAICVLNALLFGVAPAIRATRVDQNEALKSGQAAERASRLPFGRVVVTGQIALSLTLVIGAGLFLATLRKLYQANLGFNHDNLLMLTLDPHLTGYQGERSTALLEEIMQRVRAIPGVKSATFMNEKPFTGRAYLTSAVIPGYVPKPGEDLANNWTITYLVGPRYFGTLQMPLLAGRDFDDRDTTSMPKVAILNETMARHYFGDRNPIGQGISFDLKKGARPDVEIIGVVRDARYFDIDEDHQDAIFTPLEQSASRNDSQAVSFAIRTAADPDRMAADVRAALRSIDANLPLYDFTTMNQQVQSTISQQRMMAMLSGFFGLLALTLSAIGLYGVLAYSVSQRTGEIGVRMALGANRGRILQMILGETGQLLGIGVIVGLGMSFAATRLIKTMLYGVTPDDPRSFLFGSLILVLVGVCAALLPARRAVRIEPMEALRYE